MLPIDIESRLNEIRSEVEQGGIELVDVLYHRAGQRGVLTFLVDKKGGISLEECAEVNRRLGAYFDRLSDDDGPVFLRGAYYLEVNSPGLDRPLKKMRDYERVIGQRLRVQARDEQGTVKTLIGTLLGVTESGIELEEGGAVRSVRFDSIFKSIRELVWKKRDHA